MDRDAVNALTVGGVFALSTDRKYYYHSTVGAEYSHWTEEGKKALAEYMNVMIYKMKQAEEKELDKRAKNMILNELKGDSK